MTRDQRPVPGPISHTIDVSLRHGKSVCSSVGSGSSPVQALLFVVVDVHALALRCFEIAREPLWPFAEHSVVQLVAERAEHAIGTDLEELADSGHVFGNQRYGTLRRPSR